MGESVVENLDPRLGSTVWADWTDQASNRPLIVGQGRLLFPTQEMLPFQRVIRTRAVSQGLAVNQRSQFRGLVPNGESWRVLGINVMQNDIASKQFVVRVLARNQNNFIYTASHAVIPQNLNVPLYPASSGDTADSRSQTKTGPALELFPGDTLQILQLTGASGPSQVDLSVRYELIPPPLEIEVDTDFVASFLI